MGLRVGILGGMFDPIHIGHCILAERCIEQANLHTCYLVPAYQSPLRKQPAIATPYQRWMMASIVARTNPKLRSLDWEIRRKETSYTIETIEYLRSRRPQDKLYLIIGADQLIQFTLWHRWQEILKHVELLVAPRSGVPLDGTRHELEQHGGRVTLIDMPMVAISSTLIRQYCAEGASIRYLVHDKVRRYILRHKLYRQL
jgi:nicotinate-nucleotide adenylyltransferase